MACAAAALAPAALGAQPALAAPGDPSVATIRSIPVGGSAPVIVVLSAQADPRAHRGDSAAQIDALQRIARRTQPGLIRATGVHAHRYWLVNAISLDATRGQVRALAARPEVASVVSDPQVAVSASAAATTTGAGPGALWAAAAVGAPRAREATGLTGAGVRIGSIDTGVDASHPDLQGKIVAWQDFVAGSAAPYDDNGHGTHTIGSMVGGSGIGVAPGASVLVAKAIGADGVGRGSAILAAAQWLADPDGDPATPDQPAVINNSWAGSQSMNPWFRPMVREWRTLGIVPVFAAGNGGPAPSTIESPADYPEALAVGATDQTGTIAPFSARGPVVWSDPDGTGPAAGTLLAKPDLVAPGVGITSTAPGGGYQTMSGTSMAAPLVAGAAALVRQAAPTLSAAAVMNLLRQSAAGRGSAGPDPAYGAGLLDVPAALAAAGAPDPPPLTPATAPPPAAPPAPDQTACSSLGSARVRPASRGRITLSTRQLAINQRISQAGVRRVNALAGLSVPGRSRTHERFALTASQLTINQRISQAAVRRVNALAARVGSPCDVGAAADGARHRRAVTLSVGQLAINQRISQAAVRRVRRLAEVLSGGGR